MQEAACFSDSRSAAVAEPTRREALEDPGWTRTWGQGSWHLFLPGPPVQAAERGRRGEIGRQRDVRRSQSACEAGRYVVGASRNLFPPEWLARSLPPQVPRAPQVSGIPTSPCEADEQSRKGRTGGTGVGLSGGGWITRPRSLRPEAKEPSVTVGSTTSHRCPH
ncbi:FLYWCH family member 2 isoform X1 [Piliocolobus tephrosceles]|uniref:FLYWCH family member 2 isoform X1 n=1 Tax=Piliocolobus tephrosceles TaxID=591936 RepID=UPI000C29D341|nr:FLYWCH family member 2 isoform X1 [Piliocolobus tephrosceles]